MKVLIVAQCFVSKINGEIFIPGGTERYVYGLAKQLKIDNYEVVVLSTTQNKKEIGWEDLDGINTYRIYVPPKLYPFLADFCLFFKVLQLIKKFDPIIVHTISPVYKYSCGAILAAKIFGKKTVYTRTTLPHEDDRGFLPVFLDNYLFVNILKMTDATIALSNQMKKKMDTKFPNIKIIPSFIMRDYYRCLEKKPYSVLYVGRLDNLKGVDVLIESISFVRDKIPSISLHIVGAGEYLNHLINLTQLYSLEENITFEGHLKDFELPEIYSKNDIFVFPSFTEGLPMALIEAMSAGLPIIASNIEPCAELLEFGKYGILVKKGDPIVLADNIYMLITNETLKKEYSTLCMKKSTQYTQERVVKRIEQLYDNVINNV